MGDGNIKRAEDGIGVRGTREVQAAALPQFQHTTYA